MDGSVRCRTVSPVDGRFWWFSDDAIQFVTNFVLGYSWWSSVFLSVLIDMHIQFRTVLAYY